MKSPIEQKSSDLLTKDENITVFRLLGSKCQSLATSVIQLYITKSPSHSQWIKKDTGVMCFVKDNLRRNYFFRLYCLNRRMMIWEQELYTNLEYITLTDFFHSFEADDCMAGLNFAKEDEAHDLRKIVNEKLLMKRQKREERKSRNSLQKQVPQHQQYPKPAFQTNIPLNDQYGQQNQQIIFSQQIGKTKKRRHLTKADIGLPSDFKHVSHVGWDPNKGFDIDNIEDPHLKQFFNKAGVSDKQLRDKETRDFIYDFINRHGGMNAVESDVQDPEPVTPTIQKPSYPLPKTPNENVPLNPPPVPARTTVNRSAPPPPPPGKTTVTPRPPPVNRGQPPPRPSYVPKAAPEPPTHVNNIPPPPHVNNVPAPPPPPPMNDFISSSFNETAATRPPPPPSLAPPPLDLGAPVPQVTDARSALLDSIRSGKTLKPVEQVERKPSVDDSRGNLLKEIIQGIELKPVANTPRPAVPPTLNNSLAAALSDALKNRALAIHSDSESSSEDDEEWD